MLILMVIVKLQFRSLGCSLVAICQVLHALSLSSLCLHIHSANRNVKSEQWESLKANRAQTVIDGIQDVHDIYLKLVLNSV